METGFYLGSEGIGVTVEEGIESGPSPPERGKDKQSKPSKGRDNIGKEEEEQPSWTGWRRIGTNRVSSLLTELNFVNMITGFLILIVVSFFQENKS